MRKLLILMTLIFSTALNLSAQRTCGQEQYHQHLIQTDPNYLYNQEQIERYTEDYLRNNGTISTRSVVTIPVVFHVVYNTSTQNIADSKILAQISQLNLDYSKLNTDNATTPSIFQPTGNMDIQFCLATRDPNGNATTGIERRQTTLTSFSTNNAVKYYAQGGLDAWPSSSYLNIWICNISGGVLGYAQFPGGTAATDGVVLLYSSIGSVLNPAGGAYGLGRTATHEVGHWLNLRHIWGDATCGSDLVSDTPSHNTANYGCPTYPHLSTCTGTPVEMTMNYMDYTDDACMYMFSNGQAVRSQALFATGGSRASLLNSLGCSTPNTSTCGVPTNTSSSNITTTSATISWSAVAGVSSYNLQYKLSTSTTWTTLNTTSTSVSLTGLVSNSIYNYQVQSVCGTSTSAYSTQASFTTLSSSTSCTDVYESNNSLNTAKTIPVNTTITGLISTSTDKDYFKFTTTTTNKNIRIDLTNLPADYDLKLYNPSGTLVASSLNVGTTPEVIIYNNGTVGTYKVYVYGYSSAFNATSCYSLLASISSTTFRTISEEQEHIFSNGEFDKFVAYPNPTDRVVNFTFVTTKEESYQINMIDAVGREVYSKKYVSNSGTNQIEIDISEMPSGCYNVLLIADDKRANLRVIKK